MPVAVGLPARRREPARGIMPDFRSIIDAERTRQEISISELARRAEVHRAKLSQWLAGTCDTTLTTFERVCRALGISLTRPK